MALQCCRMNFTFGVKSVRFQFSKSGCTIRMREGDDAYTLECGLDGADRLSPVSVRGEVFQTACSAVWAQDEFSRPKLIVYCRFIETPHTRILSFLFDRDGLHLRCTEWPRAADATKNARRAHRRPRQPARSAVQLGGAAGGHEAQD